MHLRSFDEAAFLFFRIKRSTEQQERATKNCLMTGRTGFKHEQIFRASGYGDLVIVYRQERGDNLLMLYAVS